MTEYRVRSFGGLHSGSPKSFAIERYEKRPFKLPWVTVESGFRSYEQAQERLRMLKAADLAMKALEELK